MCCLTCISCRPNALRVLGGHFVLWWNKKEGSWCCHADMCPHRFAPLSEGKVTEDSIM